MYSGDVFIGIHAQENAESLVAHAMYTGLRWSLHAMETEIIINVNVLDFAAECENPVANGNL